jgi:hypothetical protein
MSKKQKLSEKHKKFIDEYLMCWNATAAYRATYPKASYDSAGVLASNLLGNVRIQEEISERLKHRANEVLARLADQARGSHYPFIRIDADGFVYFDFSDDDAKKHFHLIKKIKTKRQRQIFGKGDLAQEWEGEWVEVELHDPQRALELIGKHHSLFVERDDKGNPIQPIVNVYIPKNERDTNDDAG